MRIHEHVRGCACDDASPLLGQSLLNQVVQLQAFETTDVL